MKSTQTLKTYLTEAEIEKMIDSSLFLRDKLIIQALFRTGLRVSELCSLKLSEIDLTTGALLVRHLKSNPKKSCSNCHITLGRNHNFCPGCGAKLTPRKSEITERRRIVYLDSNTLCLVKEYLQKRQNNSDRLISLTRKSVYNIIRQSAQAAGLKGRILLNPHSGKRHFISPHRLRDAHAAKSVAVDSGLEAVRGLQEQLGHASINTTMRYVKISPEAMKDRQDKLWRNN
ncbi:tyrosine-type recombinase/integrase [Dehalococcoidia bacterium]|nr:tyrosine-type recombinase/integrase [Dehalococcoidia bacterium]